MNEMKYLEQIILKYLEERGWHNLRPGDIAKSISIESGELLENFQWDNPSLEEVKKDDERIAKIKKELADVLIYCFNMAVLLKLDTREIIEEKLEKIRQKYPAELFKNSTQEPGTEAIYWKIKKEHRQKSE